MNKDIEVKMIPRFQCGRCSRIFGQIILLTLIFILKNASAVQCLEIKNVDASLENVYRFSIIQGQKHILVYAIGGGDPDSSDGSKNESQTQRIMKHAMKVICTARHKHDPECPLIVTVTQKNSVVFWKVASEDSSSFLGNGTVISNSERTICLENDSLEDMMFTVELSTCNNNWVNYTLSVHMRHDLIISMNQATKAQIMPSSPAVYYFPQVTTFKVNDSRPEFIYIQLTSSQENCMIMSIQQPVCPIADTVESMLSHGQWQTVSVKTGMTIPVKEFPFGFFIVFLLLPDDTWCNHPSFGQDEVGKITSNMLKILPTAQTTIRRKSFHFTIRDKSPTSGFEVAIFVPLSLFIAYIFIVFVFHSYFHQRRCQSANKHNVEYHTFSAGSSFNPGSDRIDSVEISKQCQGKMGGSADSIVRSRIQIAELINSHPERLMVQSKRYFFAGILCASFYCVPVFQLILSYHKRLRETGNFDLCYFNYMCSHMLGMFHDFNHIYSNIGYMICGLAFMAIVFIRQVTVIKTLPLPPIPDEEARVVSTSSGKSDPVSSTKAEAKIGTITGLARKLWPKANYDISRGVFVHHGLFYAMGLSLFLTGLMSGAYHICPNQNNFQFDTLFIYTIAALGCVSIYTFRHPTYVSASMTFLVLAAVAASTVVGLLWESNKFRLFFTVTHITFLIMILVYIHYVGHVRVNGVTITEWKQMFTIIRDKWRDDINHGRLWRIQHDIWSPKDVPDTRVLPGPSRLIFPILVVIVNSGALTMIWIVMPTTNFASQLLAVYVINCSCYTVYYSAMKMVHFECRGNLWVQPGVYLVLSGVLWTWALSYFGDEVTLWERSPAESRARNEDCVFLGFYDSHDVWHFLSSAALFSSMMTLLTIDDDLIETPKSEIPVF